MEGLTTSLLSRLNAFQYENIQRYLNQFVRILQGG